VVFIESAGGRDSLLGFRARAHLARDPPNVTAAGPGLETVTSIVIKINDMPASRGHVRNVANLVAFRDKLPARGLADWTCTIRTVPESRRGLNNGS